MELNIKIVILHIINCSQALITMQYTYYTWKYNKSNQIQKNMNLKTEVLR